MLICGNHHLSEQTLPTIANMLKHRIGAVNASTDAEDQAIAGAFKNMFCIPLDFELLETHMPFYQAGLGDRLEYELTFKSNSLRAPKKLK